MTYCQKCGNPNCESTACAVVTVDTRRQPFKCPVCDGTGKVSRPSHVPGDVMFWPAGDCGLHDCQACDGKGIVWGPPC